MDYRLSRSVGATVTAEFSYLDGVQRAFDTVIPKYVTVMTDGGMEFVTLEEKVLRRNTDSIGVPVVQGVLIEDVFTGTGEPDQKYKLSAPNVAENFIEVYVADSYWEEDRQQLFQDYGDNVYTMSSDLEGNHFIEFSQARGEVPALGMEIRVVYVDTAGDGGNILTGALTLIDSEFENGDLLKVTNPEPATGGRGEETVDEARIQAPKTLRTNHRAVSKEDFESLAIGVSGIAKAHAADGSRLWKDVYLYVAADGGTTASDALKQELHEHLARRMEICTDLTIHDAEFVPVDLYATIFVRNNFRRDDVKAIAEDKVREFLAFENRKFGGGMEQLNTLGKSIDEDDDGIQQGDVYELIENIPGVRYMDLTRLSRGDWVGIANLEFTDREIPYLRNLLLTMEGGV